MLKKKAIFCKRNTFICIYKGYTIKHGGLNMVCEEYGFAPPPKDTIPMPNNFNYDAQIARKENKEDDDGAFMAQAHIPGAGSSVFNGYFDKA